ncbi:hereditary hemochromatosis protein homolog [Rana temporaria]|uniref:hereditary hemochromatosis protein homolog n=1 Tax=Rana temporaria TaxID=8407 RepID=UPI001AAD4A9F|nr:hereditary hemochromatosis protein homolog [Rana temporaria]
MMEQYLLYILMSLIPFSSTSSDSTQISEEPLVKVTHSVLSNSTDQLNCRAYGHSPKNISMAWYQNKEAVRNNQSAETLQLPDLTYLTSLKLNITTHHDEVYNCHVNHSSLKSTLVVKWGHTEESTEPIGAILTICLAAVVIFVITIIVSVLITKLRKKK